MAFTVPNQSGSIEDPTGVFPQAQLDSVDLQILAAGVGGVNGVSSGCAVTAQGSPNNTVAVASGTVVVASVEVAVTSGNVTMTAAHATLARFDLLTVTNAGVKTYTAGTAAATPVFPAIPANSVVLAAIYVDANDNVINSNQIIDKRVSVPTPSAIGGWTTVEKSAGTNRTSTTTLAVDPDLQFTMAANGEYRFRGEVHISIESATPDFKYRHVGPASPTKVRVNRLEMRVPQVALEEIESESAYSATDEVRTYSAATELTLFISGFIHNGANAGDFEFWWAPNASSADDCIVLAGSYIDWARVD